MSNFQNNDENIPAQAEAYYETVASQEEVYLEETEEELRAILIAENPTPSETVDEPLDQAAEELITGDSDDPPQSDEAVVDMLRVTKNKDARRL